MATRIPLLLISLMLAMAGCERPQPPVSAEAGATYNLTAYLQQQREQLVREQPMVLKGVRTQDQDPEVVETSAIDWEDELSVFEQADLNRPSLQEYYTKQEEQLSDGRTVITYTKLEDAEPQVHYLRLVLGPNGQLHEMNARLQDKNIIFYSRRNISLSTDPQTGDISSYSVDGVQKMVFGDSLHYHVDANL